MKRRVTCPYCSFKTVVEVTLDAFGFGEPQLVMCGSDEDGCDRRFVADPNILVTFQTRKIEGEETPQPSFQSEESTYEPQ